MKESLSPASFIDYEKNLKDMQDKLQQLQQHTVLHAKPLLLHLDVAAMYPNIILSQRLQPTAVKTPQQCAECPWKDRGNKSAAPADVAAAVAAVAAAVVFAAVAAAAVAAVVVAAAVAAAFVASVAAVAFNNVSRLSLGFIRVCLLGFIY